MHQSCIFVHSIPAAVEDSTSAVGYLPWNYNLMNKIYAVSSLAAALTLALPSPVTGQRLLPGYRYDHSTAPTGKEWQSPADYALGKEQPHAYFFSFAPKDRAERVLPEYSSLYQSLDGTWRFHWVRTPEERPVDFYRTDYDASSWDEVTVPMNWNVYGLQRDGKQKYGTPIYVNQPVIFYHKVRPDDWREGVMRTPPKEWTTYRDRNEVGSYRRTFKLPTEWSDKAVFLNFDGVDSFFYLWINGRYVGFSKNSRNLASFDISPYLRPKEEENVIAVEVYRNSDGSFLEAQDMFRLPGIFRSVYLTAKPKVHLRDLQVIPDVTSDLKEGSLRITSELRSQGTKAVRPDLRLSYKLYALPLYSDEVSGAPVATAEGRSTSMGTAETTLTLQSPALWSAEAPHRYVLVAELYDKAGKTLLDRASIYTGFRKVEIRETPADQDEFGQAGRYFYVNHKPVKFKGTNRHETDPSRGHAITHEQMEREVFLMKRANINHVRNSHYPPAPYWYYLCDKYGIYLEDEANIESHQYYYGKASLSHVPEFEAQHVSRMLEMVHANINHPSIVIWSLGNEAGPGVNFVKSYEATKRVDTSRPVQYERNNDIVDMGSNQYPSIAWVEGAATGKYKIKYPFHISEYAHSMGNACGGLADYWKAIESSNYICGGAIWDWVDQALYNYTPEGLRYLAYGGNFGDFPNDGMFVMNGIMFADLQPKPQYYEVKKVYQQIGIEAEDLMAGRVRIFNKHYFVSLADFDLRWSLYRDGVEERSGVLDLPAIAPRTAETVTLPLSTSDLQPNSEYFVKVECRLRTDKPWAKAGYVAADEQLALQSLREREALQGGKGLRAKSLTKEVYEVAGSDFSVQYDLREGTIHQLVYAGDTVIYPGNGPRITAFRAPADNDIWVRSAWTTNGLHNLKHRVLKQQVTKLPDGSVELFFTVRSQAPYGATLTMHKASGKYELTEDKAHPFGENDFAITSQAIWRVYPDGSIQLRSNLTTNKPALPLGRLGYEFVLPRAYDNYTYYGRGPINNYGDRKASQYIEQHKSKVAEQFVSFPKPQTMANREEVRWVSLTNASGRGMLFLTDSVMTSSALPYSAMQLMMAPHPHELPAAGDTHLVLSRSTTGLGGASCGQGGPLVSAQSLGTPQLFSLMIRPLRAGDSAVKQAKAQIDGPVVSSITRDPHGDLVITGAPGEALWYTVGRGRPQRYTEPIDFSQGGEVSAWAEGQRRLISTMSFGRMKYAACRIVFCSSEEYGYEAQDLLDESPDTMWHTVWTLTVPKHPHWIDFDLYKVKTITGLTYLPRQDESTTGDVKEYALSVSDDGKQWTEVLRGTFGSDKKLKEALLKKPVRARYLRFTALSAHDGQDYASGSEIHILAE